MDMSWMNNPAFENIDPKKLAILSELMNNSKGKKMQDLLPMIMNTNSKLNSLGMKFSNNETSAILDVLTVNMSVSEKQKVEQMKKMIESMSKK